MTSSVNGRRIDTILFDCDNTLVLSEALAFEGCADLINQICTSKRLKIPPFSGETLIKEFVGQNFRGMMKSLQERYGLQLTPEELEDYVKQEEDVVIAKLKTSLVPCDGVTQELARVAENGDYTLAVVSSSALRRVKASVEKVGFDHYFGERIYSAATSLNPPTSKPDPAVYLHALKQLGKEARNSVAVEDSKSGTLSAYRAGIPVLGYVGPYADDKKAEMAETLSNAGATVIMHHWSEFPSCMLKMSSSNI